MFEMCVIGLLYAFMCEMTFFYFTHKFYCFKNKGNCNKCNCWSCPRVKYIEDEGEKNK